MPNGHDLEVLEGRAQELRQLLQDLSDDYSRDLSELSDLWHLRWFTTPVDWFFLTGTLDTMIAQTQALTNLKQLLVEGSRRVEASSKEGETS